MGLICFMRPWQQRGGDEDAEKIACNIGKPPQKRSHRNHA